MPARRRRDSARRRRAAFAFIFVTVLLDMLALGIIIPVLPKLVVELRGRRHARCGADILGLFGTAWALMQFLFSPMLGALSDRFGRRPVILISNFGLGLDYILMALAPSLVVAVRRPRDLRHHRGEHLDRLRLRRRRDAAGAARRRASACSAPRSAPASCSARRSAACSAAIDPRLPFWIAAGLEPCQRALRLASSCRNRCRRSGARRSAGGAPIRSARSPCCARIASCSALASVNFLGKLAHAVLPIVSVLYTTYRYGWDAHAVGSDARGRRRLRDGGAGRC